MSRWKAAAIHLSISLILAAIVATLLYTLWFPPPYFHAAGAGTLIPLLMGVDIAIGPLLTLLVISPAKPKRLRRLDVSIIASLQAVAFGYGFYVICQARPVFIVGEVDRLVVVAADALSDADLAKGSRPEYRHRSWNGPRLVGALPPTGSRTFDVVAQAMGSGKDIDRLPEFYVPYEQVANSLKRHGRPLASLKPKGAEQRRQLAELEQAAAANGQTLYFLPLERQDVYYTAIISSSQQQPIAVLTVDPWNIPTKK
ncbi:TfpX/TfpZ family type IV pilin accessory protein [Rhodanobacter umsongensis]